jgi:4-amino-4-deoxy-L-arabinose transferase-like glycosyltransferase
MAAVTAAADDRRTRPSVPVALVVVAGVAFVLRLAWAFFATRTPVFVESGDAYSYFFYGRQIAEGGGYLNLDGSGQATAYYPIGYPALLGGLFWIVLHTPLPDALPMAASLLHVVLGTASVALLFVVVRGATDSTRTALVAALVLALWPNVVFGTATMQLELAFTFFVLAALAVLATHPWADRPPSLRRSAAFGALLAVAVMIRPFAVPFLALPVLLLVAHRHGWRSVAATVAVAVLPVVALVVPWTVRNQRAMGAPLPFSSNMGDTVCLDRNLDARGGFRFADHDGCALHTLGEVERNRISTGKAIEFVREHPGREALQIVRRARLIFEHDHDGLDVVERYGRGPILGDLARTWLRRVADVWFFAALAFAAIGVVRALRASGRRAELVLLAVPPLVLIGIAVLLWGTPRFHGPAVPFIAAFAAVGIAGIRRDGDTAGSNPAHAV